MHVCIREYIYVLCVWYKRIMIVKVTTTFAKRYYYSKTGRLIFYSRVQITATATTFSNILCTTKKSPFL